MRQLFWGILALGLTACGPPLSVIQSASEVTIPAQPVVLAISAFDGVKITATNYLRLVRCNGSNGPICRDPIVTKSVIAAVDAGTIARNNLKAFMRSHKNELGLKGDYDALVAATSTIQDSTAAYRAAKGS